jgi:hypothetical protein
MIDWPRFRNSRLRKNFISIIDQQDLARFGLNLKADADSDQNSITEKWEGLALISVRDPRSKEDYILLVGNDNDFKEIDHLS